MFAAGHGHERYRLCLGSIVPVHHPGQVLQRGGRVLVRTPLDGDRAEFVAGVRSSRRLHRGLVRLGTDDVFWRGYLERAGTESVVAFLVCGGADGTILGGGSLSQIVRHQFQNATLGYWAFAGHTGRGYFTEGVDLMLRHAFADLRLHRVEANIQPGNGRSLALAARLGLRHEGFSPGYLKVAGRWRDHERLAITVEDWRRRPARHASG
jgi:[ribosomal protein S5]-alanine N-acetyltransferase